MTGGRVDGRVEVSECGDVEIQSSYIIYLFMNLQYIMRPGATKGTLRRKNENLFFDVLCLITFHWLF